MRTVIIVTACNLICSCDEESPTGQPAKPVSISKPKEEISTADLSEIYYYATKSVSQYLKAPGDAKFSSLGWDTEAKIVPYGYHQWLCGGYVDAQNSFGAKIRSGWLAYIFKSDIAMRSDYLVVGDSIYGTLPPAIPFPLTTEQETAMRQMQSVTASNFLKAKVVSGQAALKSNQSAAAAGDAYGLLRMGERYRDGDGVAKDLAKAHELLHQAALKGSDTAQRELVALPK